MHALVEDSIDVMVKEYLAKCHKSTHSRPLYWSHKTAMWPDPFCVAMDLLS